MKQLTKSIARRVRAKLSFAYGHSGSIRRRGCVTPPLALTLLLAVLLSCAPAFAATNAEGPQPGPLPERSESAAPAANANNTETANEEATAAPQTVTAASASRYFLPNLAQATPAKIQRPWGACWAFAVAGALESSILKAEAKLAGQPQDALAPDSVAFAELDLANLPLAPDVSERAIAWFAHEPQTEASGGTQASEGFALNVSSPEEQLSGGNFATAASALTAWQSLVSEETAPYEYNGYVPGDSYAWYGTDPAFDARYEDWSLADDVRLAEDTGWRVSEVLRLQSPAQVTNDGQYTGYDAAATDAIKRTLVDVGGVAVAVSMEQNIPSDVWNGHYTDAAPSESFTFSTWSQYSDASAVTQNHAAVILGWDDAYPAENFQGSISGQPPANGAWLCKNSWGNDALFDSIGGARLRVGASRMRTGKPAGISGCPITITASLIWRPLPSHRWTRATTRSTNTITWARLSTWRP